MRPAWSIIRSSIKYEGRIEIQCSRKTFRVHIKYPVQVCKVACIIVIIETVIETLTYILYLYMRTEQRKKVPTLHH